MTELFNFHDGFYVIQHNWLWLLVALALGVWVGWRTNTNDDRAG